MKTVFYCHRLAEYAWVRYPQDPTARQTLAQMAFVPAIPAMRFHYRVECGAHILTDSRTGLMIAYAAGRAELHEEITRILHKRGPKMIALTAAQYCPIAA